MSSAPPTGSVEAVFSRTVVTLPTAWRVVIAIGSIASTCVLFAAGIVFQVVRAEWVELRAEIREVRSRVDGAATSDQVGKLAEDVRALERRVTRVENGWMGP
jgi:hypothetical protein